MTLVMFLLSRRFGMLADRHGPRLFMGLGPLVGAGGLVLFQRVGRDFSYAADVLPAELLFALGLSMTVAPLTAAVLAGSEGEAGIASAVNNAVARVAGLIGTAAVGAVIAAAFSSSLLSHLRGVSLGSGGQAVLAEAKRLPLGFPKTSSLPHATANAMHAAAEAASVHAFHLGMGVAAALVAAGGAAGLAFIRNPARGQVLAEECAGGQLVGVSSPEPARHGLAGA